MSPTAYPHLTDSDSVRREAAAQHGSLTDAAAFVQAHKAQQDPDVAAASLRPVNAKETEKLEDDPSLAQSKIDEALGEGNTVLAAVVRGDALSAVVQDASGATRHAVVGWNDNWKSVAPPDPETRANAEAAAASDRLSGEFVAEVKARVDESAAKIREEVAALYEKAKEEIDQIRQARIEELQEKRDEAADSGSTDEPVAASASRGRRSTASSSEE